ncbi:nucleotide pyrophosphatase [Streptomyces hygroscopicus subsp. limoneus]|nr:nucleotide pyrophosphatase [Streptomyces hygroscopicus subsp. limoneus]
MSTFAENTVSVIGAQEATAYVDRAVFAVSARVRKSGYWVKRAPVKALSAVFVHLDNIDHAGHTYGAASQQYLDAIHGADAQVGQIVAAVEARPAYAAEDWLIMVTADHGHTDAGGHGGSTLQERQTFLITTGQALAPGSVRYDVKMPDVAASALVHLGIPLDPAWGLDGRPVQQPGRDDFDALRSTLATRVDETGVPAATVGFTHTPPPGWSVDNSAMGGGGVAEWRGWSFTTDEFWTKAQRDQNRECNIRARNVFAVADGDEWADKAFTGTFDSTLVSPAYPVTGGGTAVLTYTTYYRHEAPQKGEVLVSYDGGSPLGPVPVHRRQQLVLGDRRGRDRPVLIRRGRRYAVSPSRSGGRPGRPGRHHGAVYGAMAGLPCAGACGAACASPGPGAFWGTCRRITCARWWCMRSASPRTWAGTSPRSATRRL